MARGVFMDLTGRSFGGWSVVARAENKGKNPAWLCECICGTRRAVLGEQLRSGGSTSCGCLRGPALSGRFSLDLDGQRYGRLLVVARVASRGRFSMWRCRCDCGNEIETRGSALNRGKTQSCGCLRYERSRARTWVDRSGRRYGKLVALRPSATGAWVCRCDCGQEALISGAHLATGHTKSCGCLTLADILDRRHAVYRLYDDVGDLLYVGLTVNPRQRFREHKMLRNWWPEVAYHRIEWFPDRTAADAAETIAIQSERPAYNKRKTLRAA